MMYYNAAGKLVGNSLLWACESLSGILSKLLPGWCDYSDFGEFNLEKKTNEEVMDGGKQQGSDYKTRGSDGEQTRH